MVRDADVARWRLRSQHLVRPHVGSAGEAVSSLLAVQAENPGQAAWAVASRTRNPDQADLGALLDDGAIVRTHVLRPTWHFVRAEDIGWLLDLTGPRVRRVTGQQLRNAHGLDDRSIDRAVAAMMEALASRGRLTRAQLAEELLGRGVPASGQMVMILLAHAELDGLICSGRAVDGEHAYALMAERVPAPRRLDRADALAELALRYFTGHGPATERDLAYWATLTLTDVRAGLRRVRDRLDSFEHDGRTFWHAPADAPGEPQDPAGHLLQVLDETYRGYQDSRWVLDAAGDVPRTRVSAVGMALVDAQLVADMRRTIGRDHVRFDLRPYRALTRPEIEALDRAARRCGEYLRLEATITLP
ncbi:winged helix DNA-binding domain-containing protein [Actinomadura darangshiensis]|uniref:Winged helix DNA-binding domain-containing protein n=1 Tax=Actinomadura darangshiensis TaxID=705336 RepID=A0A4R5BYW6_9ACTN|nr:winged helix DNA-binding domain-containing protein [Actinomadura darangshiensis]TDD91086.1 winged helix DNA-binding domain-containing protein [Actinomadura darangshiensis]